MSIYKIHLVLFIKATQRKSHSHSVCMNLERFYLLVQIKPLLLKCANNSKSDSSMVDSSGGRSWTLHTSTAPKLGCAFSAGFHVCVLKSNLKVWWSYNNHRFTVYAYVIRFSAAIQLIASLHTGYAQICEVWVESSPSSLSFLNQVSCHNSKQSLILTSRHF